MRKRRSKDTPRAKTKDAFQLVRKDCAAAKHGSSARMQSRTPARPVDVAGQLVSRLFEDVLQESCAVFVGAGCTTEGGRRHSRTFYEEIREKCRFPAKVPAPAFPELMEYFCRQMDGGQHNRLIREAVSRIERFCVPSDERAFATMFGNELAEIPYFNRFVTTNWDPFLERSLEILIPMIEDRDVAFWDDRKRQVLKLHGCITRPYSLVATKSDYESCLKRNPLIFNKLKDLMATKTFIFVGYSLRDPDFREVWEVITKSLGRFAKLAYAVDPDAPDQDVTYWKNNGIEIFRTSDLAFVRELRARLESKHLIASRTLLQFLQNERHRITSIHLKLRQTSDGAMASAMYQDGLLHALSDVLTSTSLGTERMDSFERDLLEAERAVAEM
jgi:SIR2-like domain